MRPYRTLLVGMGRIGYGGFPNTSIETHFAELQKHEDISLWGICDSDVKQFEKMPVSVLRHFLDIDTALDEIQPEIVVMATPPETHRSLCQKAVDCDSVRGIFIEKPMSATVEDARAIADMSYEKPILVGYQRRYDKHHIYMKAFLTHGHFGKPQTVHAIFSGSYLNNGTHAIDTARYLAPDAQLQLWQVVNDTLEVEVVCDFGTISLESYGRFAPGYRAAMYDDLIWCIENDGIPRCDTTDGLAALRIALINEKAAA